MNSCRDWDRDGVSQCAKMFALVDTKDAVAVETEVKAAFAAMFPAEDPDYVARIFALATNAFAGNYADYQPIDAAYHDLEHTLQGTLCMARMLRARHLAGTQPAFPVNLVKLGLLAILLHDTGYLKHRDDTEGTGAKYTATHVTRSIEFAAVMMRENGFGEDDIRAVQNMIQCTGVDAVLSGIPFRNEEERLVGLMLGTADLVGQMAAADYVDKLPVLYQEFAEAARHANDRANVFNLFTSAEDLQRKTPAFWEYTKLRLTRDFAGLYRFLNDPYPFGGNEYLAQIEANVARVRRMNGG